MIERPKMTRPMYQALKRHIMRERERKKQEEQEQDKELERMRLERELKKRKAEEDSLTLEQTKEQVKQLEAKLEQLKGEKHELFSQFKKVLHQEDETRKRSIKEQQSEVISMPPHQYHPNLATSSHHVFIQPSQIAARQKFMTPVHQPLPHGLKRQRSPSPPPSSTYQPRYTADKFPTASHAVPPVKQETYGQPKSAGYPQTPSTHVTYANQTVHSYPNPGQMQTQPQQQPASYTPGQGQGSAGVTTSYATSQPSSVTGGTRYPPPPGQSAFTSYPSHYAQHQPKQTLPEGYPQHYQVQRLPQPGYIPSNHSGALSLQQQLEHANQKSGFNEDKFKMQQMRAVSQVMPSQISQAQSGAGQPPPPPQKGSIVAGFPMRTQPSSLPYQPSPQIRRH